MDAGQGDMFGQIELTAPVDMSQSSQVVIQDNQQPGTSGDNAQGALDLCIKKAPAHLDPYVDYELAIYNATTTNLTENPGPFWAEKPQDKCSNFVLEMTVITIIELHRNPAGFESCIVPAQNALLMYLDDDCETLGKVVDLIVEESAKSRSFCYHGARLCHRLYQQKIRAGPTSFKAALLTKCREKYHVILGQIVSDEEKSQVHAFMYFLSELYICFRIDFAERTKDLIILVESVIGVMVNILQKKPTHHNIKAVSHTLRLIGWELETDSNPCVAPLMAQLMDELYYQNSGSGTCNQKTKEVIGNIIKLKNKNWDKIEKSVQAKVQDWLLGLNYREDGTLEFDADPLNDPIDD